MTKTKIGAIIGLMGLALAGITVMQVTWIRSSLALNAVQFDEAVFSALSKTADRLERLESLDAYVNGFSVEFFENRKWGGQRQRSSWSQSMNYILHVQEVPLENRIDPGTLDTLIQQELKNRGIDEKYSYGVFSTARRNFIIVDGHFVASASGPMTMASVPEDSNSENLESSKYAVSLYDEASVRSPGLLLISFPGRSNIPWSSEAWTIAGTALLLSIILGCFAYSIVIIVRQKRLSKMKSDFISNMTHEFKTPIATISLAADSITNPKVMGSPERLSRFADIIRQENGRMHRQVEKVLQAALIDRRDFGLKPTPTDLNECLREAVEHMLLQVEKRGGTIEVGLMATHPVIEADATHLSNLLHNLMDNANKYSPETPRITVRTEDVRGGVKVTVADRGIGMTKEDQQHIFDKFYRVHTGNRHDVKGFGLGLSYVKAVVEAHGGQLGVRSTLGGGSTFSLTFPHRIPAHLTPTPS